MDDAVKEKKGKKKPVESKNIFCDEPDGRVRLTVPYPGKTSEFKIAWIDKDDEKKAREKTWYVRRQGQNSVRPFIYANIITVTFDGLEKKEKKNRVPLTDYLLYGSLAGSRPRIIHQDGNIFNCCRINLIFDGDFYEAKKQKREVINASGVKRCRTEKVEKTITVTIDHCTMEEEEIEDDFNDSEGKNNDQDIVCELSKEELELTHAQEKESFANDEEIVNNDFSFHEFEQKNHEKSDVEQADLETVNFRNSIEVDNKAIIGKDQSLNVGLSTKSSLANESDIDSVHKLESMLTSLMSSSSLYLSGPKWEKFVFDSSHNLNVYAAALSRALAQKFIHFPLPQLSDEKMIDDCNQFSRYVKNKDYAEERSYSAEILLGLLKSFGLPSSIIEVKGVQYFDHDLSNISVLHNLSNGRKVCTNFFTSAMIMVRYDKRETIQNLWYDEISRCSTFKSMLEKIRPDILDPMALIKAFGYSHYFPSNFPPSAACNVLGICANVLSNRRGASVMNNLKFLDPCSGWGGRFMGYWFSDQYSEYVGIDPNPAAHVCYDRFSKWLMEKCQNHRPNLRTGDKFMFIKGCAEDENWKKLLVNHGKEYFDVVFTSPPYFSTEVYANDNTQSCIRYGSYLRWRSHFLHRMIDNCVDCLKSDGIMVWNVKNCSKCPSLVDDVVDYMTKHHGFTLIRVSSLHMSTKAFNSGKQKTSNAEPVMFFAKL